MTNWIKIKVSMYCSYIWQAAGPVPVLDFNGSQFWAGSSPSQWQGCGRLAIVRPPVVLSSSCSVWGLPRHPSMKIWSCFAVWPPIMAVKALKVGQKLAVFDVFGPRGRYRVWEIGCSSAASRPIVLLFCVRVPKRSFYEDLVVWWLQMSSVLPWKLESQRYKSAKIWPFRGDFQ